MLRSVFLICATCLVALALSTPSRAASQQQAANGSNKGSIQGTVTNPAQTVISGASVVLTNKKGLKQEVKTNEKGVYAFTGLEAGTYDLTITASRFAATTLEYIYITPDYSDVTLDATLEPTHDKSEPAAAKNEAPPAAANPGSLAGTVTDSTQSVISGAAVTLTNQAGLKQETKTNEKGLYSFRGLQGGTYNITIDASLFASKTLAGVAVTPGVEATLDATLVPAAVQTDVNVAASNTGQIEVETASLSGTITEEEVTKYALNGRAFHQLLGLTPGVSNQTGQDEAKVGVVGSVKYSVNGGRVEYNTFEVDGSDVLNTGLNGAASTLMVYPSVDAIEEVKVLTANYGAQYGRTASGTVQVTTKSGTSQLHGNLYDFIRNEAFNARNYFDTTSSAPLYRRQDFGGTIGGPLTIPGVFNTGKKKTFFFFSEEVRLEKTPTEYNQAVPSLKERGLIMGPNGQIQQNLTTAWNGQVSRAFDFSDVCPPPGTASTFSRRQYPDCPSVLSVNGSPESVSSGGTANVLPAGYINKNALTILNSGLIPLPNSSTGCNYYVPNPDPSDPNHCYDTTVSPPTHWREELFRIDHNLNDNTKLAFRYIHDAWDTTVLTPQWSYASQNFPSAGTFPTVENRFVGPGLSLVGRLTKVVSPTLLNDLVLSYSNSTITLADQNGPGGGQYQLNPSLYQPLVGSGDCNPTISSDPISGMPQCGMGSIFNNGYGGKMPGIAILGTNAAYGGRGFYIDPSYMPWGHTDPTYSIRDDVSKSVGKHTLMAGLQYVYSQRNQTNNVIGGVSGDQQGLLTFSNLANSTGNAFADFLLEQQNPVTGVIQGYIQNYTQDSKQGRYYQRYQIAEPYVQDNWKITPRLMLNLGLRVSLFGTYHEKNNNAWNWVPSHFNASRFSVDPCTGVLLNRTSGSATVSGPCGPMFAGTAVGFDPSSFQLTDPSVVTDLGLVQCGTNGTPSGCMKGHLFNPAPRFGFAWDPKGDGKTSIRGGYGIFYEHGTGNEMNSGSLEASAPLVLSMTQPNPLNYMCIGEVGYGGGNNSVCSKPGVQAPPPNSVYPINVTAIPTHAVWSYTQQWSLGMQRELAPDVVADLTYVGSKGTHLTIARQLNQIRPLPVSENPFGPNEPLTVADCQSWTGGSNPYFTLVSGLGTVVSASSPAYPYLEVACAGVPGLPNVNAVTDKNGVPMHPYPGLGKIYSLENVANSSYNAFQFRLQRTRGALTGGIAYSYSHSIDDSSDRSDPVLANSYDLRENRASSDFDQRHSLTINYTYRIPGPQLRGSLGRWFYGVWREPPCAAVNVSDCPVPPRNVVPLDRLGRAIFDGWELAGVTSFVSGTPFSVINSAGNTGIGMTDNAGVDEGLGIAASYPDVVRGTTCPYGGSPQAAFSQSVGPLLGNPCQFVAPRGLTFGNAGRNFLNNPSRFNSDISLLKHFKLAESSQLEFRAEVFNVFNNTQFRIYDPDNPGSSGNNVISCYGGPNYSAGAQGSGANCVNGASFLRPVDAHRPRTMQFALKASF
jgi:hypothetical protein